ncbi:hypothetical protein PRO82_001286 [Candidatus Protochlamydia amoebophila]|nr:hypothetical protein [Candidatus Protochlamydia amoebophila]
MAAVYNFFNCKAESKNLKEFRNCFIEEEIKILAWVTNYFIVENLQIRAMFKDFIQLKGC